MPYDYDPVTKKTTRQGAAGSRNIIEIYDDFLGDTFSTDLWLGDADTGGTAPAFAAATDGTVALVGGTTDDVVVEFAGPIIWSPAAGGLYFETRIKQSAITTWSACVGLFDARAYSATMPITYATTTFTTNATSGVGWVFDTDGTNPDIWQGIGVKAGTDTAAVAGAAPVANTYETLGIGVDANGTATFFQNGSNMGSKANAVTAGTLLAAYVGCMTRTTSTRTLTCDYVYTRQNRV